MQAASRLTEEQHKGGEQPDGPCEAFFKGQRQEEAKAG
jgi:hypothetical protein